MSPIDPVYLIIFSSGLLGGFGHCIVMCGPLIATYTITIQASPVERLKPHMIYHLGRLMSYGLIGGFMGLTGSFVTTVRFISHIQSIAMALAGIFMIIMGLSILQFTPSVVPRFKLFKGVVTLMKAVSESGSRGSLFPLGLLNGIIPCGLSYTAFIAAAGIGASETSPPAGFIKGFFLLLLFGIGTIPPLLLISQLAMKGSQLLKKRLYSIAGIFMILSGMMFIYRALYL
ncbi:MAG: hypothetical protein Fur0020_13020 [Thermodesulfovibrionia bacterium]